MKETAVPVTVTREAAARVAELGVQEELERMLEYTCRTVPGLRAIDVQLALPYDTGVETSIVIEATREHSELGYDPTDSDWGRWKVTNFPPDIARYFIMISVYDASDAG